jgi:serine/threonine protein kinase/tetratricopeptide (TPR) repeat protein
LHSDRVDPGCFSDDGAAAYLAGSVDETQRDQMRSHLDSCENCRDVVRYAALAIGKVEGTGPTAPFAKIDEEEPHRVGRFTILAKLGSGGMGVVYAAFDAELDRKVALKLVRTELRDEKPEATRAAMLREAKSMAKVEHPNVITVFEVGTHEDQIYVAMELIAGGDLRAWVAANRASWRDILATCRQAGLGLAAAHRAGLVHRDFKPDNVLIGKDGRVRVTDFGLARRVDEQTRQSVASMPATMRPSTNDRLTRTGAIVGTPAYMAPEQHEGKTADARADQFAFCVTVWEALFGQRPFAGDTYAEILANVMDGNIGDAPRDSQVPQQIREALRRGLQKDPAARFASMDALLAELSIESPRSKVKLALMIGAPLVAFAGLSAALIALQAPSEGASCPTPQSKLAGVWDAKRRDHTSKAISEVKPFGPDVAKRTAATLDAYTQKWSASWAAACDAKAKGEQSPTMFDLRVACLTRRLHAVDALATALEKKEPAIVARAGELLDGLAPVDACDNTESLAKAAPPPSLNSKVAAIDNILERAYARRMEGHMADARKLAEEALAEAERINYRPSAAAALQTLARIDQDAGDYASAEKLMQRASTAALSSNSDELAAVILTELADIVGYELARPAEAHRLVEIARGAIERIGNPPQYRIDLLTTESRIALNEGKHGPAMTALDEAERITNETHDEMRLIPIVAAKGIVLLEEGKFEDAMKLAEQQLALRAKVEGAHHPNYAAALEQRATLHFTQNRFEKGLEDLAAARKIKVEALGPDTPELLSVENNAGVIAGLLGDWEEALRSATVCRDISLKQNGEEHPTTALAISNMAAALRELGRLAEAEPLAMKALELRKRLLGDQHQDYAVSLTDVADLRLAQGRPKDAAQLFVDAKKVLVAAIGEESPLIPYADEGLGEAQIALGDARGASATLTATLARLDELDLDPVLNAKTRMFLAEAKWRLGDRAGANAVDIEAPLAKLPKGTNKQLRERIATWRAKHR